MKTRFVWKRRQALAIGTLVGLSVLAFFIPGSAIADPNPGSGTFVGEEQTNDANVHNAPPLCATVLPNNTTIRKEQTGTFSATAGDDVAVYVGNTRVELKNNNRYYFGPDGTHLDQNCADAPGAQIPVTSQAGIDSVSPSADSVACGQMTGFFSRIGEVATITLTGTCTVNGAVPGPADTVTAVVTETEVGALQPCGFQAPVVGGPTVDCPPVISYTGTYATR